MRKSLCMVAAAMISAAAAFAQDTQDWACFAKYCEANITAAKGAGAVFMGDSITEGWESKSPAFFSGNGYLCRGISGQVTSQMLIRFRPDVLALEPECVVILAGTNDIAQNQGPISLENIFGNIASMCELADHHDIEVIICSVLPAYEYPWKKSIQDVPEKVMKLNSMLKEYAAENGYTYVDFHTAMKDSRNGLPEELAADGIHPTPEGYRIMEEILNPVIKEICK